MMKKIIKISYLQTIVKTAEEMKQLAKLLNIKGSLDEIYRKAKEKLNKPNL